MQQNKILKSNSYTHQNIDAVHPYVTDFVNEITYWQLPTHGHELLVTDLEEFKKTVLAINDQEAMAILVSASEAITHKSREIWLGVDWCNRIEGRDTSNPEGRKYIKRNLDIDNPNFLIRQGYSTKLYTDDQVPVDMKYGAVIYSSVNELKTVCRRKPNHLLLKNDYIFELVLKMFDNAKKYGRLIKPTTTLAEQKQVKLSLLPPTDQRVILFKSLKKIDPNFKDCELETFIQTLNSYRLYGPAFNKPKSPELAEIDIQAAFPTAIIANSHSEAKEFLAMNGDVMRQQIVAEVVEYMTPDYPSICLTDKQRKNINHLFNSTETVDLVKAWTLLTCMNARLCSSLFDNSMDGYIKSNKFSLFLKNISPTAKAFAKVCDDYQKEIKISGESIGTTCHRELSKIEGQVMIIIAEYLEAKQIDGYYSFDGFKITQENISKINIEELQQIVREKTKINFSLKIKNNKQKVEQQKAA